MKIVIAGCFVLILAGCSVTVTVPPKKTKVSGEGISYTKKRVEQAAEKYASPPQSYSTSTRNGVRSDKDKLKKQRKEDNDR